MEDNFSNQMENGVFEIQRGVKARKTNIEKWGYIGGNVYKEKLSHQRYRKSFLFLPFFCYNGDTK